MLKGNKKLFLHKDKLISMVNLRRNGWAFTSLALLYNCNRDSPQTQCIKYGIQPQEPIYTIERIATDIIKKISDPELPYEIVDGEKINKGKTYAEYLRESSYPHRKI